ncbi:hypothetical protein SLA2020_213580 [Shorea laevis]
MALFVIFLSFILVINVSALDACPKCGNMEIPYPLSTDSNCGDYSRLDDNSPFNISSRSTVMLLNCSESILLSPLNCSVKSFCRQFEQVRGGSGCRGTLCCRYLKDASMTSHRIRVRSGGCTAYTSVVDIKPDDPIDSWNYGTELQWLPPN